ncbi:unnamed protein product, partial [Larinioides sclopetarius]
MIAYLPPPLLCFIMDRNKYPYQSFSKIVPLGSSFEIIVLRLFSSLLRVLRSVMQAIWKM